MLSSIEDHLYKYLASYKKMPDWVKRIFATPTYVIPRKYLLGKRYDNFYQLAKQYDFADKNEISKYQFLKLKELINHCYNAIPFYKTKWNEHGINLDQIQNFNDFSKNIPFTHRGEIQKDPNAFLSTKYKKTLHLKMNTGGSTGESLILYSLKGYSRTAENAHMHLLWDRIGFKIGDRVARLRGDFIGKDRISSFDPWRNMLILSSFVLNKKNANLYLEKLKKYKVQYINAYPASLLNLIQSANIVSFSLSNLKGIFLGSENIYDWQLEKIKHFFNIENIFYWYGHGEMTNLGGICEKSNHYHFLPTYGYTEFIDSGYNQNDKLSTKLLEIVGTSFINPVMPLIRYKTQDFGINPSDSCKLCGRNHMTLGRIIGREQELAIGNNGERITLTALIFGRHGSYFNHIKKMQVINTKPGQLVINIIPKSTFTNLHEQELINTLSKKEGMPFNTEIKIVQHIPTTHRGKHRFLIRKF